MLLTENLSDEVINESLTLTGVKHLKDKSLANLSGGEFQRVLLARAISKKPDLLFLMSQYKVLISQEKLNYMN